MQSHMGLGDDFAQMFAANGEQLCSFFVIDKKCIIDYRHFKILLFTLIFRNTCFLFA